MVLAAAWLGAATSLCAQAQGPAQSETLPRELEGVGITDHTGEAITLDTPFRDETGRAVRLEEYFKPGRPVILTLNYFRCPQLCVLTLNGLCDSLDQIDWSPGREFDVVTISINHREGPDLADAKKKAYLSRYTRESANEGWHFLTGDEAAIRRLTGEVGFGFKYDERSGDYAHSSSIMFLTPEGRISRYMNDVVFDPRDVRLALVEASQGAIGSPIDKFLLFTCFMYDPLANSYAVSATKLVRFAGALTVVALGLWLIVLWRRDGVRSIRPALAGGSEK